MRMTLRLFREHLASIVPALVLALLAAFVDQYVPRLLQDLMNALANGQRSQAVLILVVGIGAAYVGAQVLRIAQRVALERAATRMNADLMREGMSNLMGNTVLWHMASPVGQIQVRLDRSSRAISELLRIGVGDVIAPLLGVAFALLLLFEASLMGGAVAVCVSILLALVTGLQIWHQNGVRVAINRAREHLGSQVVDAMTKIETVKLNGGERVETERVALTSTRLGEREFAHHKAMGVFDIAKACIDHGGFALVVAIAAWNTTGSSAGGAVLLAAICYQRLMEPLKSMHRIVDETMERLALAKDYASLKEEAVMQHSTHSPTHPPTLLRPGLAVSLRDVSFTYPGTDAAVLRGVNLDLPANSKLALVGPSGGGKSTLVRLLSGVLMPSGGSIQIGGVPVGPIEVNTGGPRRIAVLPQETHLFAGTLIDNLRYGNPDATDEDVLQAAKEADIEGLLFDVDGAPRHINSRGDGVSGGQKQRIGIARVLLRKSEVIVLDEPTSAQDASRRVAVFELIARHFANRTVIVITHDASDLSWATHIATVKGGTVSLEGKVPDGGPRDRPPAANAGLAPLRA